MEFYCKPLAKGLSGWRGPANVIAVATDAAMVHVKYQGKTYDCRNQDVRPALLYFAHNLTMAYHISGSEDPYDHVVSFINNMAPKEYIHLGVYQQEATWNLQRAVKTHYPLFLEVFTRCQQQCRSLQLHRRTTGTWSGDSPPTSALH